MKRVAHALTVVAALLIAAVGVLLMSSRLRAPELLRGGVQDYGVRELATAALAGLAIGLCALVVVRTRQGSLRWALLLAAPVALLAGLPIQSSDPVVVYDGSYVPLKGVTMSQDYSSSLRITYGSASKDLGLLSLAVLAGIALPLCALRPCRP